jgi:hypothetical protein
MSGRRSRRTSALAMLVVGTGALGACHLPPGGGEGPAALDITRQSTSTSCQTEQDLTTCTVDVEVRVTNTGGTETVGNIVLIENTSGETSATFVDDECSGDPLGAGASCDATLRVVVGPTDDPPDGVFGAIVATDGITSDSVDWDVTFGI